MSCYHYSFLALPEFTVKRLDDSDSDVDESAHLPQQRRARQIIYRSEETQKARSLLPVCAEEQAIVEAVNENDVRSTVV